MKAITHLVPALLAGAISTAVSAHAPTQQQSQHIQAQQVVVVKNADASVRQLLGHRFGHILYDHKAAEVRVETNAEDRIWLGQHALQWQVDPEATADLQRSLQPIEALRAIPGFACYRTVEETTDTIEQLTSTYPQLASATIIGSSWQHSQNPNQGYELQVLRLTNANLPGDKPKMFVMSSVHAREYTPAELMTRYAEELLQGYGRDANATWLLDHMEFHFLLQANPDGRKRAEAGASWRKNVNTDFCGGGTPGIDLNRNYPVFWNYGNGGSSTNACSETFRGPVAASEPETQAVVNYVRSIFPDTRPGDPESMSAAADPTTRGMFLDIHSYSRLVLWPWGHAAQPSPNADALATLGMRMAWFNDYEPQQSVGLYPTRGTTDDFAYGELGLPAYTFELGTAFFQSCNSFESTILPQNLAALRYASRVLQAPYQLPAGPDAADVTASPSLATAGSTVTLTALIDDSRYRNQQQGTNAPSSPRPRHAIAGARYYINQMPWEANASGTEMTAVDGSFDAPSEQATAEIDTSALPTGQHLIYVQGYDANGEIGPPSAVFLTLRDESELARISGVVKREDNAAPIADALITADNIQVISASDGRYEMLVEPDTTQLQASADQFWPKTVTLPTLSAGQSVTQDIELEAICTLFSEDAEDDNAAGWTAVSPWAITTLSGVNDKVWADSPSGNYGNNLDIALTSPAITLKGGSVRLEFDHRCQTEARYDVGHVEASFDGGNNWVSLLRCDGNNDWKHESINVNLPSNAQSMRLRFRLQTDQSITADGWAIDTIHVFDSNHACETPLPPLLSEIFEDGFEEGNGG